MPTHSNGSSSVIGHPLFHPDVWIIFLRCFCHTEAVDVAVIFGWNGIYQLMRDNLTEVPSRNTWLLATKYHAIGTMIYLMKYKIECPKTEIMQYAVDNNYIDVVFLLQNYPLYDCRGNIITETVCPNIDTACVYNSTIMVRYLVTLFSPRFNDKLLNNPIRTVTKVMEKGHIDILRLIVPQVTVTAVSQAFKLAGVNGHVEVFEHALNHIDKNTVASIPESVIVDIASAGQLEILQLFQKAGIPFTSPTVFSAAFIAGHVDIVKFIHSHYPHLFPSEEAVLATCKNGKYKTIRTLPRSYTFTDKCVLESIRSKEVKLINLLGTRLPSSAFKKEHLLLESILHGGCLVTIAVFMFGEFTALTPKMKLLLVSRNRVNAMKFFHLTGITVYESGTFLEACRSCNIDILNQFVETKIVIDISCKAEAVRKLYVSVAPITQKSIAFSLVNDICSKD